MACSGPSGPAPDDAAGTTTPAVEPTPGPGDTAPPVNPVPLATGMSVAAAASGDVVEAGHGPGFATQAVATVDGDGQPVLVWGTYTDATGRASVVQAARYDPATGSWTKPVELFSGRVGHDGAGRSIAATTDATTGALHVVWSHGGDEPGPTRTISLATSTDGGRTWTTQRVAEEAGLATPSVAAADDLVHVTWWSERDGVVRAVGTPATEPTADRRWERFVAPVPSGFVPLATAPAVTVDPSGAPVIAYATTTPNGSVGRVLVWRPDRAATAVPVADVGQSGPPALALGMHGDAPVVALTGTDVRTPAATTPTTGPPGTSVLPAPASTTTTSTTGDRTERDAASPWAWVVRVGPTGAPTAPVALEAGSAGRRTDDLPLPPGIGLAVLPDGTAAVALVPVVASTTCVVARDGPDDQPRQHTACSRSADDQPQVIPSGRAASLVRLADGRLAVPLGNSEAPPGLPVGLTLWVGPA